MGKLELYVFSERSLYLVLKLAGIVFAFWGCGCTMSKNGGVWKSKYRLNMWGVALGTCQATWRGKVIHVVSIPAAALRIHIHRQKITTNGPPCCHTKTSRGEPG